MHRAAGIRLAGERIERFLLDEDRSRASPSSLGIGLAQEVRAARASYCHIQAVRFSVIIPRRHISPGMLSERLMCRFFSQCLSKSFQAFNSSLQRSNFSN